MANTNEQRIKEMYGANLESQKQQLAQSYQTSDSALNAAKQQNQKVTDANLNRTAVEAQKAAMSDAEIQNAQGLSSGAAAQVRLARNNQTAANMTSIRAAQQEADAQVERERALLSKEYTSAIQKAQADNDLELAKALYENAQVEEQKLLEKSKVAAQSMAAVGDYSLLGQLYGLSAEDVAKLAKNYQDAEQKEIDAEAQQKLAGAAQAMAAVGDYSLLGQLYGLSNEDIAKLTRNYQSTQQAEAVAAEEKQREKEFQQKLDAAKYIAEQTGDYSQVNALFAQILGVTIPQPPQPQPLNVPPAADPRPSAVITNTGKKDTASAGLNRNLMNMFGLK